MNRAGMGPMIQISRAPEVTAIVPVYRVERYVEAAVRSLLAQTNVDLEVIVVDDASPDDSASIVSAIGDPRVRIVSHPRNQGLASARNSGIAAARGPFIALLDGDDIALPGRLALQLRALRARPDAVMCGSAVECIDTDGRLTGQRWRQVANEAMIPAWLIFSNCFYVSSLLMRASLAKELSFRPEFAVCEDYDFNVRAARVGRAFNLRATLTQYRINPHGLSATKAAAMRDNEGRIQARQLRDLGAVPSGRELRVHGHLAFDKLQPSKVLLEEIDAWLCKLHELNQSCRRYGAGDFDRVLAVQWLEACAHASAHGIEAIRSYLAGRFRRLDAQALGRLAKMHLRARRRRRAAAQVDTAAT